MAHDALTQIEVQNRRLVAALDRIERLIEAAQNAQPAQPADAGADADAEAGLPETQRLRAANAELRESLRALTDAAAAEGPPPGAIERALRAEVEALRAERAAEVAELDSILAELRSLIAGEDGHARA